jgi:hypothetical protein
MLSLIEKHAQITAKITLSIMLKNLINFILGSTRIKLSIIFNQFYSWLKNMLKSQLELLSRLFSKNQSSL